jgi:hypothetical protein
LDRHRRRPVSVPRSRATHIRAASIGHTRSPHAANERRARAPILRVGCRRHSTIAASRDECQDDRTPRTIDKDPQRDRRRGGSLTNREI